MCSPGTRVPSVVRSHRLHLVLSVHFILRTDLVWACLLSVFSLAVPVEFSKALLYKGR